MKLLSLAALSPATLALAAPAVAAPDYRAATSLTVRVTDHGFVPHLVNLQHGAPYVIRLVNTSGRSHDFEAPDFFRAAHVDPGSFGYIRDNKIDLAPGQMARIRLVAPDGPGRFPFKSTNLADAASGLSGYVVIR